MKPEVKKVTAIRLEPSILKALGKIAATRGVRISDVIRELIKHGLETQKEKK